MYFSTKRFVLTVNVSLISPHSLLFLTVFHPCGVPPNWKTRTTSSKRYWVYCYLFLLWICLVDHKLFRSNMITFMNPPFSCILQKPSSFTTHFLRLCVLKLGFLTHYTNVAAINAVSVWLKTLSLLILFIVTLSSIYYYHYHLQRKKIAENH